jgi:hypothetical protein
VANRRLIRATCGVRRIAAVVVVLLALVLTGSPAAAWSAGDTTVPTAPSATGGGARSDVAEPTMPGALTAGADAVDTGPVDTTGSVIAPAVSATPTVTGTGTGDGNGTGDAAAPSTAITTPDAGAVPEADLPGGVRATVAATAVPTAGETATGSGAADHTLSAVIARPSRGAVPPGRTATLAVSIRHDGRSVVTDAPVTVQMPYRTVAGTLAGDIARACVASSPTRLSCRLRLSSTATTTWDLPIDMPADADPAIALTGGCLDLDGDRACDPGRGPDVALPDLRPEPPAGALSEARSTTPAATPAPPNDNGGGIGGGGGDNLPKTGQNLIGLLFLSVTLILGGAAVRLAARDRRHRPPPEPPDGGLPGEPA